MFSKSCEIFFVYSILVSALKCYECDSSTNPSNGCGDPFDSTKIPSSQYIECEPDQALGNAAFCLKTVTKSK